MFKMDMLSPTYRHQNFGRKDRWTDGLSIIIENLISKKWVNQKYLNMLIVISQDEVKIESL